jgi:hypothetical protein
MPLANNKVYHVTIKYIKVHYYFVKQKVLTKKTNLIRVSTKDQIVDISTKALSIDKLRKFLKMLGVLQMDLSLKGNIETSSSTN